VNWSTFHSWDDAAFLPTDVFFKNMSKDIQNGKEIAGHP
jgi:hypothetical protein